MTLCSQICKIINTQPRGVIGEVQCSFFWIYTPTPYSAVFYFLHALALAPIKIGFGMLRCGLVRFLWVFRLCR
jgi:hypothetical protein